MSRELRARIVLDNTAAVKAVKDFQNQARVGLKSAGVAMTAAMGPLAGPAGRLDYAKMRLAEIAKAKAPLEALQRNLALVRQQWRESGEMGGVWPKRVGEAKAAFEAVQPALEALNAKQRELTLGVLRYQIAVQNAAKADKAAKEAQSAKGLPMRPETIDRLLGIGKKNPVLAQLATFYKQQEKEGEKSGKLSAKAWGDAYRNMLASQLRGPVGAGYAEFWKKAVPPKIPAKGLAGLREAISGLDMGQLLRGVASGGGFGMLGSALIGGLAGGFAAMVTQIIGLVVRHAMQAIRAIIRFFKDGLMEVMDYGRRLQNLFSQTGIGGRAGAVLTQAAEMGGLDPNAVSIWWSRFQANLTNITKVSPMVNAALARLNLSFVALREMSPEKQMQIIAQRIAALPNIADRAGVSMALFNRQGAEMLRIFSNPDLLRVAIEQIGESGRLFEKQRDNMAFVSNALTIGLGAKRRGFFAGIFDTISAQLVSIADTLNKMDFTRLGLLVSQVIKPMAEWLAVTLKWASRILDTFNKFEPVLRPIMAQAGKVFSGIIGPITTVLSLLDRVVNVLGMMREKLAGLKISSVLQEGLALVKDTIALITNLIAEMALRLKAMAPAWMRQLIDVMGQIIDKIKGVPKVPKPSPEGGPSSDMGALASFFAPFGKGPGDAWSKIGLFSMPMGAGVNAGMNFQQRIADNTRETAAETKTISAILRSGFDALKSGVASFVMGRNISALRLDAARFAGALPGMGAGAGAMAGGLAFQQAIAQNTKDMVSEIKRLQGVLGERAPALQGAAAGAFGAALFPTW